MSAEELLDRYRSLPGCLGVALYQGKVAVCSDGLEPGRGSGLLQLLELSGAGRASAAFGSVTLAAFGAGGYTVVLQLAGRFPPINDAPRDDRAPELPSREEARRAAEAALRDIGLLP